jgi:hypothetical protein
MAENSAPQAPIPPNDTTTTLSKGSQDGDVFDESLVVQQTTGLLVKRERIVLGDDLGNLIASSVRNGAVSLFTQNEALIETLQQMLTELRRNNALFKLYLANVIAGVDTSDEALDGGLIMPQQGV